MDFRREAVIKEEQLGRRECCGCKTLNPTLTPNGFTAGLKIKNTGTIYQKYIFHVSKYFFGNLLHRQLFLFGPISSQV